ncbi:helix-turn-helix domain-containing protein [Bradyrhizobium icense]|uniref:Helix-turn-helix domain-containing protein n=1 Tax=Bradyrhizobium icense TaxID=1274631 RepID=A0A1B1UJV9_9BRAD|nr:hypothetical protein LMTR13_25590 [Bradyrhizobium icense]
MQADRGDALVLDLTEAQIGEAGLCARGGRNKEVAAKLGLDRQTVGKWRRRFVERRVAGLHDKPRSGAPRTIDDARIEAVIVRTKEN